MSSDNREINLNRQRQINCPVLVSERLILREPHVEDMDAIAKLANNRRISSMLQNMPYPYARKHAADFILRAVAGVLGHCVYAITLADTGAFIGVCSVQDRDEGEGLEIGYWLGEPYWGQGYATEAIYILVDAVFRTMDIDALYVSCLARNMRSRRVIEKIGFQYLYTCESTSEISGLALVDQFALERNVWLELHSLNSLSA